MRSFFCKGTVICYSFLSVPCLNGHRLKQTREMCSRFDGWSLSLKLQGDRWWRTSMVRSCTVACRPLPGCSLPQIQSMISRGFHISLGVSIQKSYLPLKKMELPRNSVSWHKPGLWTLHGVILVTEGNVFRVDCSGTIRGRACVSALPRAVGIVITVITFSKHTRCYLLYGTTRVSVDVGGIRGALNAG